MRSSESEQAPMTRRHAHEPARSRVRGRGMVGLRTAGRERAMEASPRRATPRGRGVARVACGESAAAAACVRCAPTPHRHNNGASIPITSRFTGSSVFSGLVLGSAARERGGMASDRRARRERQRDRIVSMDIQRPRARIIRRARAGREGATRRPLAASVAGLARGRRERTGLFGCGLFEPPFAAAHGPQRQLRARDRSRRIDWSGEARFESAMSSKGDGTLHGRLTSHRALGAFGQRRTSSVGPRV